MDRNYMLHVDSARQSAANTWNRFVSHRGTKSITRAIVSLVFFGLVIVALSMRGLIAATEFVNGKIEDALDWLLTVSNSELV